LPPRQAAYFAFIARIIPRVEHEIITILLQPRGIGKIIHKKLGTKKEQSELKCKNMVNYPKNKQFSA
jgi:hypothetical protein